MVKVLGRVYGARGVSQGAFPCPPGGDRGAGRAREGVLRTPSKNKKLLFSVKNNTYKLIFKQHCATIQPRKIERSHTW